MGSVDGEKSACRKTLVMNFDGLCEPKNPGGVATYGVTIRGMDGEKIFEEGGLAFAEPFSDEASNNVAEYSALIRGLKWLLDHGLNESPLVIRGDSKLVINQLNGTFKVKAKRLVELYGEAADLLSRFKNMQIEWIERSMNTDADLLSRIAYSRFIKSAKASRTATKN